MSPLFSCVIPVKGARPYLDTAVESLGLQGLDRELEVIVQDGDAEPDSGQSDALNRGFAKAKGEWCFWLNADDVLLPGVLGAVRDCISGPGGGRYSWISGNMVYLDADGCVSRCARERGWRWSYAGFPVRTYGPSSFFRRELLARVGGLDTSLRYSMDTDLWCRFRAAGAWHHKIPRYVWGFRVHEGSLTSGDLVGKPPPGMREEGRIVNERYGTACTRWRKTMLQAVRWLDGSYEMAVIDTFRYRGRSWREIR